MSDVDQIRQEQEALIAAPRKPFQGVVQTISNIFHPLLMLTYAAIVMCLYTPISMFNYSTKVFFVGEVGFYTLLMPVIIITLLHVFHVIGHWALRDVRDRSIPFLTNFVCYLVNYLVLQRNGFLPEWVLMPFFGSVVLTFVAWIVSFWWKISAHASADAAVATFFLLMFSYIPEMFPQWLVFASIIIVGAVCSIRVYLGRHTLSQVGMGTLLGITSMLFADYIYFSN